MPPRSVVLATLVLLAACGSGTVRPGDDIGAVAPAPPSAPSPPMVDPDPAPPPAPAPETPTDPVATPPDTGLATRSPEVEIRRIGRWISSGIRGARRLVIRDPDTWSRFWSELGAGVKPQVDFSRDLVIAVASGERPTGGHDLVIERVTRSGGELQIEVVESSPAPDCITTAALTQPVDVVMVSAQGITGWSFIDRRVTRAC